MIDAERLRPMLEDERGHAAGLVSSLRAEIASADEARRGVRLSEQDPERASTVFEISKEASLLDLHLEEINGALARIDEGTLRILPGMRATHPRRPAGGQALRRVLHRPCHPVPSAGDAVQARRLK